MNQDEQGKKMGEIIARAWADDAFKQRLLSDASAVLKEEGIEVPPGVEVRAVENTEHVFYLVLSPKPAPVQELDDTQLEVAAGSVDDPIPMLNCWTGQGGMGVPFAPKGSGLR